MAVVAAAVAAARGGDDDDGPNIAVRERVAEAARSAKRRKGLSFVVVMICGALTVLGAIFAPRNYEVEARVLVQRTQAHHRRAGAAAVAPRRCATSRKEYEEQVMAHDNIIAIVRQKNLVARWDDMRQPHRRLIDKINRKLGKAPPSDDEKFEALVTNIQHRLKVWVDATTVTVKLEWSEPEAARDIVDAAVKNFLEARFQSEVGVIPERLKILEAGVTQAHKDLETAAAELVRQQKLANPTRARQHRHPEPSARRERPPVSTTPIRRSRRSLDSVRQQIAVLQEAKLRREAELNQELIQKQQTLAEGHPEIIALKQTIDATRADPAAARQAQGGGARDPERDRRASSARQPKRAQPSRSRVAPVASRRRRRRRERPRPRLDEERPGRAGSVRRGHRRSTRPRQPARRCAHRDEDRTKRRSRTATRSCTPRRSRPVRSARSGLIAIAIGVLVDHRRGARGGCARRSLLGHLLRAA